MPRSRVAMLAADGVERRDVEEMRRALEDAGRRVDFVAVQLGEVWAMDGLDKSGTFPVDVTLRDARAEHYESLLVPGGVASADRLRRDPAAVALVFDFAESGKPVAVAGHAPWLLIEADLVRGKTVTSWPSLRSDLVNAGAEWAEREVAVDFPLLTCAGSEQVGALCEELLRRAPAQ